MCHVLENVSLVLYFIVCCRDDCSLVFERASVCTCLQHIAAQHITDLLYISTMLLFYST